MSKRIGVLLVLGGLALLCFFTVVNRRPSRVCSPEIVEPAGPADTPVSPPPVAAHATSAAKVTGPPVRPRFVAAGSPGQRTTGLTNAELRTAAESLRAYRIAFKENPVGTNAEITAQLLGQNARALRCLPDRAPINDKGELIDRWGQPFYFHQISARIMEVRSAGPDQRMWNDDDEILR